MSANVRLVRALTDGGMGSVWVAHHEALKTDVVVKFMSRELASSADAVARFGREAAAASQVKSPHVVQTLDHGVMDDGTPYIVMELLEGRDLAHHIDATGKLPPADVVEIVAQMARALTKAHAAGIVHRDIKPNNIFLCDAGGGELFVKLLDFGIAKSDGLSLVGSTTRTGSFVGSPYYMSPEQVVGDKSLDRRTDLWSLGVVAFEALTGEKPFFAETMGGLALKIHRDPLPMPTSRNPELPASVDAWFEKACARDPAERFASAREMSDAFARAMRGERRVVTAGVEGGAGSRVDSSRTELAATQVEAGIELGSGRRRAAGAAKGKVVVAFAIGVVAVGIGFAVPTWWAKGGSTVKAVEAATTTAGAAPSAMPAVTLTPTESAPSVPVAPASAAAPPKPRPAVAAKRPVVSAPPLVATPPPPPPRPPPGSDDDIK